MSLISVLRRNNRIKTIIDYIVDITNDDRISTSTKVHEGYLQFISKHKNKLEDYHFALLYINYCLNTNTKPAISKFSSLLYRQSLLRLVGLYIKSYLPMLFNMLTKMKLLIKRLKN